MGRRFLLILGILLLVSPAPRPAHAQEGGGPPSPDAPSSAPAEPPPPRPLDLPSADAGLAPAGRPGPGPDEPSPAAPEKKPDGARTVPALDPAPEDSSTGPAAGAPRPPGDPGLTRTESAADGPAATAPTNSPPAGDLDGIPADRLPTGRQAVAVTVDVQSPPSMNLHKPATVGLVIRNTGTAEALQVRVRYELPDGLKYLEAGTNPPPSRVERGSVLSWSMEGLPAGSDRVISVKVEPVKRGDFRHGASVWFETGTGSETKVLQPRLKVEQKASAASVLKGHSVEFKIWVTNEGDGPARNVRVAARLSPGLRYGSGGRGESEVVTDPIPVLGSGQTEELDPLLAEALKEGPASCTVTARSPDVVTPNKEDEARSVAEVKVVEPRLEIAVTGPERRCTDTVAPYEVVVKNPGSAPARKVRVGVLVPSAVRLPRVPEGAHYDQVTRRLVWTLDTVEAGSAPAKLGFEVRVGDVGKYKLAAEAVGVGLNAKSKELVTEVFGMPDLDLDVSEKQRVLDVGGKTVFAIRLHNYGTKDATNIQLHASVSRNLRVLGGFQPEGLESLESKEGGRYWFRDVGGTGIKRLGPGQTLVVGLQVEVAGPDPKVAKCTVQVTHDELAEGIEGMAAVKILAPPSRSAEPGGR